MELRKDHAHRKKNPMPLLISSFDATIRVKRAFHPAPATRGFASHVFLVLPNFRVAVEQILNISKQRPTFEFRRHILDTSVSIVSSRMLQIRDYLYKANNKELLLIVEIIANCQ